ncbi:hypothetical protein pb186bvf_017424 [Paramecium bursaria]
MLLVPKYSNHIYFYPIKQIKSVDYIYFKIHNIYKKQY